MNTLCLFSFKYPHSENSSHSEFPLSSYGQGGQIPYRTERILQSFSRLSSWKTTTSLVLIINSFVFWKDTSWQGLQNPLWPTQTDHLHILKPAVLNLSIWCSNLKINPPHRKSVHVHICAKYHYNFRKLRDPLKLIHGPQVKNLCSKPGWGQILETPPPPSQPTTSLIIPGTSPPITNHLVLIFCSPNGFMSISCFLLVRWFWEIHCKRGWFSFLWLPLDFSSHLW